VSHRTNPQAPSPSDSHPSLANSPYGIPVANSFDYPDPEPSLAVACIALALHSRHASLDLLPPKGSWHFDLVVRALTHAGCPGLLEGLPRTLIEDHPSPGTVTREFLSSPHGESPASAAFLPSRMLPASVPATTLRPLGAFYTPAWLVHLALDQAGWPSPSARLVDPTCGAGAFLAGAALALRSDPSRLTENASRISGADIHPLAVLGARVACLCAVADLLEPGQPFDPDIRVANLFDPPPFEPHDIVVGNPPWIRFSELAPETQSRVANAAHHYGLVPPSSFHGGSQLDLSAVCAYRMLDEHLRTEGRAALVMPSSLLRSASAAPFRRFVLPDGTSLRLDHVTDFGSLRVFPGATNRTSLLAWTKGQPQRASILARMVEHTRRLAEDTSCAQALELLQPKSCIARFVGKSRSLACFPHDVAPGLEGACAHVRGRKGVTTDLNGAYFVRVLGPGSQPGLLLVTNNATSRGKTVPVHTFEVEEELVFPLLKGSKQIHPFHVDAPTMAVLLPNRTVTRIPDERVFAEIFPAAHAHFAWVEKETGGALSARSTYRRMLAASRAPFFSVYNVGDYTFAPHKVVWAEIARTLVAGIATSSPLADDCAPKVIVPDHKVYFAPFDHLEPARFLCALLSSTVVRTYVDAVTEKLQVGSLLDRVRLPAFDPANEHHRDLVDLVSRAEGREQRAIDTQVKRVLTLC